MPARDHMGEIGQAVRAHGLPWSRWRTESPTDPRKLALQILRVATGNIQNSGEGLQEGARDAFLPAALDRRRFMRPLLNHRRVADESDRGTCRCQNGS